MGGLGHLGTVFTLADRRDPRLGDPVGDQPFANARRAPIGQAAVVVVRAPGIRVALDLDRDLGVLLQERREFVQGLGRGLVVSQLVLVVLEVDDSLVVELALLVDDRARGCRGFRLFFGGARRDLGAGLGLRALRGVGLA
jgi:hypothetical protein